MMRMSFSFRLRRLVDVRGSALLYMIGALVVIGLIGAGIAVMSPSATQSKLEQEAGQRAFYNAQSGLNFIMSMQGYYAASGNNINAFINAMGGNGAQVTYNLPGSGQFSYQLTLNNANGVNGTYNIAYLLGKSADASGNFKYSYLLYGGDRGASGMYNYNVNTGGAYNFVLASYNSGVNIAGNAAIVGDIYGKVFASEQTNIAGNIISQGTANLNYATHVVGNLCAKGDVVLDQSSVSGSVNATGNVTMKFGSTVTGSVYAGGQFTAESSVIVGGSVHANSTITTGFNTNIGTNAYSNSNITFTDQTNISNSAYSGDSIVLWWGSTIGNKAIACNGTAPVDGATVGESITSCSYPPNVKPTAPTPCNITTSPKVSKYTAGTVPITVGWHENTYNTSNPLVPGLYGDVSIDDADFSLKAGTYVFNSLTMKWGSQLNLDVSEGDITILVVGAVEVNATDGVYVSTNGKVWKEMTTIDKKNAAKVYLEAHDSITLKWGTNWYGTMFSTQSFTFGGNNTIIGSYVSTGAGTLSWAANVVYVPSNYAMANW